MDEPATIVVSPNPRGKYLCIITVIVDGWSSTIRFPSRRKWVQDLFLKMIYKFGKLKSIVTPSLFKLDTTGNQFEPILWPPTITFDFPREKLRILSALTLVKAKHRKKLERLFEEDYEKFEEEVATIAVTEGLTFGG